MGLEIGFVQQGGVIKGEEALRGSTGSVFGQPIVGIFEVVPPKWAFLARHVRWRFTI